MKEASPSASAVSTVAWLDCNVSHVCGFMGVYSVLTNRRTPYLVRREDDGVVQRDVGRARGADEVDEHVGVALVQRHHHDALLAVGHALEEGPGLLC